MDDRQDIVVEIAADVRVVKKDIRDLAGAISIIDERIDTLEAFVTIWQYVWRHLATAIAALITGIIAYYLSL